MRVAQRRSRCIRFLLVLVVWGVPALAYAQDDTKPVGQEPLVSIKDRFGLFNRCGPVNLVVERPYDDAESLDLTKERIQTLAKNRLRAARLYDAEAKNFLYVRVGALNAKGVNGKGIPSGAVFVEVSFAKVLYDVKTDLSSIAKTWWTFAYGMHYGDASSLMQLLSENLDKFILEYLRVNEDAC